MQVEWCHYNTSTVIKHNHGGWLHFKEAYVHLLTTTKKFYTQFIPYLVFDPLWLRFGCFLVGGLDCGTLPSSDEDGVGL